LSLSASVFAFEPLKHLRIDSGYRSGVTPEPGRYLGRMSHFFNFPVLLCYNFLTPPVLKCFQSTEARRCNMVFMGEDDNKPVSEATIKESKDIFTASSGSRLSTAAKITRPPFSP